MNKILAKRLNIFVIVYLDDIFIYTKDSKQANINAVCWIPDILQKHGLFANLKKCCFNKDKMHFLSYMVSAQSIRIKDERIELVKNWPKSKSVQDI